jgi:glc operon protein GlcG
MRNRPTLTSADVQKMVTACKSEANKNKRSVSIAVVDDAGYLLYLERLDGAGPVTAEVATAKAATACVGAIGVSGVQSQEDEQIANAGAAALA